MHPLAHADEKNGTMPMKSLRNRNAARFLIGTAAVALCSLGGVPAANAETPVASDTAFEALVSGMKVDDTTHDALIERFDDLTASEQARFLHAAATDPLSVLEFDEGAEPSIASDTEGGRSRAASSRYTATYPVNASMFGITTGTFNLRYVFEATPTTVTRNLECTGWFSGAGGVWSVNSTANHYVSGGSGTCSVMHRMSFLYQGSAWSANKQHQVTYRGINLVSGWLKNV